MSRKRTAPAGEPDGGRGQTAKVRKPRPKKPRSLRWQRPLLHITAAGKTNGYYLVETTTPRTEGRSFLLVKYADADGTVKKYNVLLDAKGHHTCDCADTLYRGRHPCKHVLSIVQLTTRRHL